MLFAEPAPGTLEACRQCGGVLCLRPDRIACTMCGLPLPESIVKATPPAPVQQSVVAKPAAATQAPAEIPPPSTTQQPPTQQQVTQQQHRRK